MKPRTGISNPSSIEIQDEGIVIANKRKLDFVGPNVEASLSGDRVVISVASQAGGISTHALLTEYHSHPAGASGNVLTNLGSGAIPTYAAFVAGMATHGFLTEYHGHPQGASGNVLTCLGSGAIPTYDTPAAGGGIGTHNLGGAEHNDAVVVSPEDMEVIAYHAGTSLFKNLKLHGTLLKKTDFGKGGTLELPIGSFAGRIVATQHPEVDHHTGGISPLTVGSLPGNLGHLYYTETEIDTWRSGHVGSQGAHFTYPVASGGVASGAVPHAALRTIGATDHHVVNVDTHASAAAAHHAKYTDGAAQAVADTQVSIHAALADIHFDHAGHVGSEGAHHTYPVPSGGVGSGAVPYKEIRQTHPVASGFALQAMASGGIPTWGIQLGAAGGMATHAFLIGYHLHPAGASGNVLTCLGSGAIPTYNTPAGGMATHNFGGSWHNPDSWADFITKINDEIPVKVGDSVASLALWAGHIGSQGAHFDNAGHIGSAAAHHAKYTNAEAQAIADTQVSIHAALVGIHHTPTHNLGGGDHNPDTWANFLPKISDAVPLKVGDNVASMADYAAHVGSTGAHHAQVHAGDHHTGQSDALVLGSLGGRVHASQHPIVDHYSGGISGLTIGSLIGNLNHLYYTETEMDGHIGSASGHHTYPVPSGGVASGAVPFLELRTAVPVASGYTLQALASGGIPTFAAGIVGPQGTMGPTGPVGGAGPTGPVGPTGPYAATYSKRAPIWYVGGTLSVGSQVSAIMYCDGDWTTAAIMANLKVAPSGGKVHINILAAGATMFGSLPFITTGTLDSGIYAFATTGIASGAKLTLDLTEVGSSHAGEHLTVQLICSEDTT